MMTNKLMAILVVICLLVASGVYLYSLKAAQKLENQVNLAQLSARKEDLLAANVKLAQVISQLNQTLNAELKAQKSLSDQVAALSKQVNLTPPASNNTVSAVVPVPTPAPQPTPTPAPIYRPVTRAS
jgi:hypothetical protein